MPLADPMDMATAYAFSVAIDGVRVPHVMEVSGLKAEVDKVTYQQQTQDGKYVSRQMMGRQKPGEFKVKRGLTDSKTITDWLKAVMQGDLKGARKTAEVVIYTSDSQPIKRMNFRNVWIKDVEMGGSLKAGSTEPLAETFTVCWDEMEFV
ncbi:phage tail protein [Georgenia faecalis]|uniref:Phage tail protein n=1 Tax=Georgenia faecalis TaxID=2483799 RepID=A0ABV9D9X5_9MICO|nr:phage tail protein [Georgenia faecalis]